MSSKEKKKEEKKKEEKPKKVKKPSKRISLQELVYMYSYYMSRWQAKGITTEARKLKLSRDDMYDNYSSVITDQYIVKLYHLTDVRTELTQSITYYLKDQLPTGVRMDRITTFLDAPIDWTTPYMKRLKSAWEKKISQNRPRLSKYELNDSSDYEKARQSGTALDSWNLLSKRTAEGCRTGDLEIILRLNYPRTMSDKEIKIGETRWIVAAKSKGLGIEPLGENIKTFLKELSPSYAVSHNPVKNYSTWLDENVAFSESYLPGKLDGRELLLGRDVRTNMFVASDILNTGGGALSMMVLADTGGGKSFYIKFLIYMLLSLKINCIVWDRDGEYEALAGNLGYPTVSLGRNGGTYFNTIPILESDPEGFLTSRRDTMSVFSILCDHNKGMSSNEGYILDMAYHDLMEAAGVVQDDQYTWKNSSELDYKDLYAQLKKLTNITPDIYEVYSDLCRKLSKYFDPIGELNSIFKVPINIRNFIHYKDGGQPLFICINMQVVSKPQADSAAKTVDKIKNLTMSNLTDRVVKFNKASKELTAVIIEEFQRQTDNDPLISEVHNVVTGGRKLNMIPILVLNSLSSMVEGNNPKLRDILNNINTLIVGAVKEDVIQSAMRYANLKYCEDTMRKILRASEVKDKEYDTWRNSFLVKIKSEKRTELAVVKAYVPPDLRETIFKTRDDVDEEKGKE